MSKVRWQRLDNYRWACSNPMQTTLHVTFSDGNAPGFIISWCNWVFIFVSSCWMSSVLWCYHLGTHFVLCCYCQLVLSFNVAIWFVIWDGRIMIYIIFDNVISFFSTVLNRNISIYKLQRKYSIVKKSFTCPASSCLNFLASASKSGYLNIYINTDFEMQKTTFNNISQIELTLPWI
jgi:hypothetical protein